MHLDASAKTALRSIKSFRIVFSLSPLCSRACLDPAPRSIRKCTVSSQGLVDVLRRRSRYALALSPLISSTSPSHVARPVQCRSTAPPSLFVSGPSVAAVQGSGEPLSLSLCQLLASSRRRTPATTRISAPPSLQPQPFSVITTSLPVGRKGRLLVNLKLGEQGLSPVLVLVQP